MDKLFYLTSRHGDCGSNVMFHNTGGCGYGTNLDNLRLYSLKDAQKELGFDINSLPLLKSEVDKASIRAVDMQHLKELPAHVDPNNQYVIQITREYNGNDIAFAVTGGMTFNYNNAISMNLVAAENVCANITNGQIWSKTYLNSLARRTFQRENINTRKMITGPGIKYKKPRKKKESSGKTRWNCPCCGKLSWQFNPYDFEGCLDTSCEEYAYPY